ncbi:MAG: hypothetical protein HY303_19640 [Candidatus Wallbacteria bacterium]|nr:hypothetical protein [Candidatus Wallbacteria bacterium]
MQPVKRKLTIIAQDPAVRIDDRIVTEQVEVPYERLEPGPWGHRVQIIDYDASTDHFETPPSKGFYGKKTPVDPFQHSDNATLLTDPQFHAQNVYAIVMRVLSRFEFALGRRVGWSFRSHQLKVAPHAFSDANAFYSKDDEGLFFGHFPGRNGTIYTCLSHDVVAHETTHALLDGLRERYVDPSSPDQAAFHEGFADVVALLSVFSLKHVVGKLVDRAQGAGGAPGSSGPSDRIMKAQVGRDELRKSVLMGLAEEMGSELSPIRGKPLRSSLDLPKSRTLLKDDPEFLEPHRRGEVFVAMVMNAFLDVWSEQLGTLGDEHTTSYDRDRVVQEGAGAADYLLTMLIRALDYCPPVHLVFGDFLSAALTADCEIRPDDERYKFRKHLLKSFDQYGVMPTSKGTAREPGLWEQPGPDLDYSGIHFESLVRDPDEVFRFLWQNQEKLKLYPHTYSEVLSVRPCLRVGPEGLLLRETVAEYFQRLEVPASELARLRIGVNKPLQMKPDTTVKLYGGGALIFDQFGRLRFNITNRLDNATLQNERLQYLWDYGYFTKHAATARPFAALHRKRATGAYTRITEQWL